MEPGIYFDIPNAQYHADRTAIGNSGLKAMRRSPAYYFGQYLDPRCPQKEEKESAGRFFGNITHAAVFDQHNFNELYRVGPCETDGSPMSKNKKAWQEFKAECERAGATPCDKAQYEMAQAVRESVLSVPGIRKWFTGKWHGEATVCSRDPATGVLRKVRCDNLHYVNDKEVVIIDGKSFATVGVSEFTRQIAKMDYDQQAAYYTDTVSLQGLNVLGFLFLAWEDEYPYLPRLFELDADAFLNGRRKYRAALDSYAQCTKSGVWPGPADTIETITLPAWAMEHDQ